MSATNFPCRVHISRKMAKPLIVCLRRFNSRSRVERMALASIRIDADLVERAQRGNAAGRRLTWKTFASKAGIWKRFPNKNTVVKNGTLPPGIVRCTCHGRLSGVSLRLRIGCWVPMEDSRCFFCAIESLLKVNRQILE